MVMTAAEYRDQLMALAPPGAAWPREPDSTCGQLMQALADELARVDSRGDALIDETDTRTVVELLADWERVAGLPDACSGLGVTQQQRRAALTAALVTTGGQSRQYFIDLAARLGFAGATISEFDPHSVDQSVDAPLYGLEWRFAWLLSAPAAAVDQFKVSSNVDESLGEQAPQTRLECVINRLKPAHTVALFEYT
jgi:uncharacterized protein YmfQ (DUF2313 family)